MFRPARRPGSCCARSLGSVFRTHNSGQERAPLWPIGPEGGSACGREGPVSTLVRSPSAPSSPPGRLRCAGPAGGSPPRPFALVSLPRSVRQKVADSVRAGHARPGQRRGLSSERSLWQPVAARRVGKAAGEPANDRGVQARWLGRARKALAFSYFYCGYSC